MYKSISQAFLPLLLLLESHIHIFFFTFSPDITKVFLLTKYHTDLNALCYNVNLEKVSNVFMYNFYNIRAWILSIYTLHKISMNFKFSTKYTKAKWMIFGKHTHSCDRKKRGKFHLKRKGSLTSRNEVQVSFKIRPTKWKSFTVCFFPLYK